MRLALAIALLLAGCQTEFVGSAHITPEACTAKCAAIHMKVGGMVFMGEYSSACVCEVTGAPDAGTSDAAVSPVSAAAVGEAAAGVVMQQQQRDSRTDYDGPTHTK